MDQRDDFGSVMADRDQIRGELEDTRDRLRTADAEAKKVPSLHAELQRSQGDLKSAKEIVSLQDAQLEDKDAEIRRLSSELREQGEVAAEAQKAEDKARAAIEERDNAQAELTEAQSKIDRLEAKLDDQADEIDRLAKHEEHTKKFAEVVGLTGKLVS